jgi:hypothetical protein
MPAMNPSVSNPGDAHVDGVRQVLALVEDRAPRDCAALGTLHAHRVQLAAQGAKAQAAGNDALASEMAARIAATDIEIALALGVLAARDSEIARLRAALA